MSFCCTLKSWSFNKHVEPLVEIIQKNKTDFAEFQTVMDKLCTWFPPMFESHTDMKNFEVWSVSNVNSVLDLIAKNKSSAIVSGQQANFLKSLPKFVQQLHFPQLNWTKILVCAIDGLNADWITTIFSWANSGLLEKDSVDLAKVLQSRVEILLQQGQGDEKILSSLQSTWTEDKMSMDDESDDDDAKEAAWEELEDRRISKKFRQMMENFVF